MDISIIVPVYNVEKYLKRCLDSLLNQNTGVSYEIICVNDASPDNSYEILVQYAQDNPKTIRIVQNEHNLGLGLSRDKGMSFAKGELIMFIDSDDYVEPDYIETYYQAFCNQPTDIIVGGYIETGAKRATSHLLPHSEWTLLGFASACAKLFKKDYIVQNNLKFSFFRYAEDTYFSLTSFALNPTYQIIDYAGYHYWINPESITREKPYDKNYERILGELYDSFMCGTAFKTLSSEKRRMVEYAYIAGMLNTILIYNRGCGRKRMNEKYRFFRDDLEKKFPDYRNNPYMGFMKPIGQRIKTRLGVGLFKWADRFRLSERLFALFC